MITPPKWVQACFMFNMVRGYYGFNNHKRETCRYIKWSETSEEGISIGYVFWKEREVDKTKRREDCGSRCGWLWPNTHMSGFCVRTSCYMGSGCYRLTSFGGETKSSLVQIPMITDSSNLVSLEKVSNKSKCCKTSGKFYVRDEQVPPSRISFGYGWASPVH